jgi:hypothetical protein
MYASVNFRTKKAFKEAVADGRKISLRPNGLEQGITEGKAVVKGPWYPEPHKWYATATVKGGYVVKVV